MRLLTVFYTPPPPKLSFSGHDSFQCRALWLKKGFDFIDAGNSFTGKDAIMTPCWMAIRLAKDTR
ncbi:DUF4007 family protein [Fibrella aquatica]|uniref:DUF4007 family protein n=1 Tax=Fibrella aquatica TaxID=3242487 RepID=UPI00352196C5